MSILNDETIRTALRRAWDESRPGTDTCHEEGGFVLQDRDGSLNVERWPRGAQDQIVVPTHPGGMRGNQLIRATFHTHPNLGPDFQQEPSRTDVRAVRDDPDLRHPEYEGEYVISAAIVYRIRPDGRIEEVGATGHVLGGPSEP